jgi:dipeptidyl aminopeptidase/acylaminoacyl peptidase
MRLAPAFVPRIFLLTLALIASGASHGQTPPTSATKSHTPIPIETLFRAPYLSDVRLSPDGKSIAGLNHTPEGATNLAMLTMEPRSATILKGSDEVKPYEFRWLTDKLLVVRSVKDKIYAGGLHVANRDDLSQFKPLSMGNVSIVGHPAARPKNVILSADLSNRPAFRESSSIFEVSAEDPPDYVIQPEVVLGRSSRRATKRSIAYLEPMQDIVLGFESDVAGELALCYFYEGGKIRVLLYDAEGRKWDRLRFDAESTAILAVEADHRHLWLSEYSKATGFEVRRWSLETGERGAAMITDPLFNPAAGSVHYSRLENALVGITYQQRRLKSAWFNSRYAALQASVDRLLPKTDNQLVDTDMNERYFLYYSHAPQIPGTYYLLDSERNALMPFSQAYPWLDGATFAPCHAVKFTARDGLELEGYLTVPPDASAKNKVPLIVLCHGGPSDRDTWTFDPEVQFLASRGYAVLQPNYRGSAGYKPSISKDWEYDYRRMHDDVSDATRAFRQLDIIDRSRVAIMGASFGGYLAVSGAAFEEGLYRCAITNSGVFDWELLTKNAKWDGRPGEYEMLKDHVGKPGKDRDYFESISPLASIDNIKIPVFIAHGKDDNVVNLNQSTKLASGLKRRKIPVETFFPSDELHGFRSPENKAEYYHRIEVFLAKYLR